MDDAGEDLCMLREHPTFLFSAQTGDASCVISACSRGGVSRHYPLGRVILSKTSTGFFHEILEEIEAQEASESTSSTLENKNVQRRKVSLCRKIKHRVNPFALRLYIYLQFPRTQLKFYSKKNSSIHLYTN